MSDYFDTLDEQYKLDLLDVAAEYPPPHDPAEIPTGILPPPRIEDKAANLIEKGLWKGLGIIGWPFERIEYSLATYSTAVLEARRKTMRERGVEKGLGVVRPRTVSREEEKREHDEVVAVLGTIGRAWIPGREPPEGVKTFNDFFGSYSEAITGEPAAEWYKMVSGVGTSFAVTPYLFGKLLKGAGAAGKATGIPQKIAARRLPAWQSMKRMAQAQAGARTSKARELGKSLGNKEIKRLAGELSKQTGRHIGPNAVKLRLTQIIKGGVTTRPELAAKANPVIQEFLVAGRELKSLGLLPESTYITKLPRKEITQLLRKKKELERQLAKLSEPQAQEKLLKLTEALKVRGAPQFSKKLNDVALRIEKKTPKLGEQVSRIIQKSNISDEKLLEHLIRIEKADVKTKAGLISRLEKVATRPDMPKSVTNSLATGIKQLEKSSPELSDRLLKLLGSKTADTEKLRTALLKLAQNQSDEAEKLITSIEALAGRAEVQEISGLSPLLRRITDMQRRFPGKAAQSRKIQAQIDDIARRVHESYAEGGTGYFPRFYATKEAELAARRSQVYGADKIRAKYLQRRKDIPFEVRKEMGEILTPKGPVVKRLIQEGHDIEMAKLFDWTAKNPDWVSSAWQPGFAAKALPDTKAYGALRGMFVKQRIYDDLTTLFGVKGNFAATYDSFIGTWKLGKVVWNPATHFRNMFSNSILLDLSGMDHIAQTKYMTSALNHIRKGSAEYNTAKQYFMRTSLVSGELFDDMLKGLDATKGQGGFQQVVRAINSATGKVSYAPSQVYQAEEFMGKFMKYLQMREQGASVTAAVTEAEKWLFDYGDLAGWEKNIARRIMPFYTFPRKALPRVLEAAANRPHVIAKYPMIAKAMMQTSLYSLDIGEKDWAFIEENLPSYMDNGNYILMPYRDENGDLRFLDWTYLVPWGELYEANERGILKAGITNPLFQLVADIRANKSGWTDQQIYDDAIPVEEQTPAYRKEQNLKKMLYVWQGLVPSLAYKGIYWDKLYGAATGKTARGKDMLLPETIAHTLFGMRTQAVDPEEQQRWRLMEMMDGFDELRGNMYRIAIQRSRGDITEDEYTKKWEVYMDQMMIFHSDADEEAENMPTTEELLKGMESLREKDEQPEQTK
jgi:hypothetical protein